MISTFSLRKTYFNLSRPCLIKQPLLQLKSDLIRRVASFEGTIYYYFSIPVRLKSVLIRKMDFGERGLIRRGLLNAIR